MLDAPACLSASEGFASPPTTSSATSALVLAMTFLARHGDGLAQAVELLGGRAAFGRWLRLVGDLRRGRLTPRQAERELRHHHRLLTLQDVGDPDREEGGFFALLHPDSPEVHEICLLAEALERLLADMADATARQEASGRMPARVVRTGPGGRGRELAPPGWRSGPASRLRAAAQAGAAGPGATGAPAGPAAAISTVVPSRPAAA